MKDECNDAWKWEIAPNPYSPRCDTFVTNDDLEAKEAIMSLAESLWEDMEEGETKSITVTMHEI